MYYINQLKMKHYMIILIAADKAFGETHPFMIKKKLTEK